MPRPIVLPFKCAVALMAVSVVGTTTSISVPQPFIEITLTGSCKAAMTKSVR